MACVDVNKLHNKTFFLISWRVSELVWIFLKLLIQSLVVGEETQDCLFKASRIG